MTEHECETCGKEYDCGINDCENPYHWGNCSEECRKIWAGKRELK